jgi:hypothetical protein
MTDTSGVVPPDPEEPMYQQLAPEANPFDDFDESRAAADEEEEEFDERRE